MDMNKNKYIHNEIHNYPIAIAVPINNNNDRNIYSSYRSSHNSFSSIDLHTPSPSIYLTNTYSDGLKTPPPVQKDKDQKLLDSNINNYNSNSLIFTCRDCHNIFTPDPYEKGSMEYYRCPQCTDTFVERSCCASCTIS